MKDPFHDAIGQPLDVGDTIYIIDARHNGRLAEASLITRILQISDVTIAYISKYGSIMTTSY